MDILNLAGLITVLIGTLIAFVNSPLNLSSIDGGTASTDFDKIDKKTKKKNSLMKYGIYLIMFGTLLQILSNIICK